MYMAQTLSEMSTEQQPVGCYVVDRDHYQIVSGYSGEIRSVDDLCNCAIASAFQKLRTKSRCDRDGFIMYITAFPDCNFCLKRIIEMKITKIWYWSLPSKTENPNAEFNSFLEKGGIECQKYELTRIISIDFYN
uniref:CMP/dCMP-type deaminase domain-containing protein n=2 Tax=Caenorhabditis tropicalis TaxID=1561998 RepID=A0A1I7TA30_9PELO